MRPTKDDSDGFSPKHGMIIMGIDSSFFSHRLLDWEYMGGGDVCGSEDTSFKTG